MGVGNRKQAIIEHIVRCPAIKRGQVNFIAQAGIFRLRVGPNERVVCHVPDEGYEDVDTIRIGEMHLVPPGTLIVDNAHNGRVSYSLRLGKDGAVIERVELRGCPSADAIMKIAEELT